MGGASSRRKGHQFERDIANWFRKRLGISAKRGLQSRGGGAEEADVVVPFFHVECKRYGLRFSMGDLEAAISQSESDARPGMWPVVIHKRDRRPTMVTMSQETFADLAGEIYERFRD